MAIVVALHDRGVETFESCEGGRGHCFADATVRFHGERNEGMRVLAIAQELRLPVFELRRYWTVLDGEVTGPSWEMTFLNKEIGERIEKSYGHQEAANQSPASASRTSQAATSKRCKKSQPTAPQRKENSG